LGEKTQPLHIERISEYTYRFTMIEGKNRQIRRMLKLVGREVTRLVRVRFGKLKLMLKEGRFKEISAGDLI